MSVDLFGVRAALPPLWNAVACHREVRGRSTPAAPRCRNPQRGQGPALHITP